MTRAEWLDYFETVNGRKPSVQEMADALKAGEFVNEALQCAAIPIGGADQAVGLILQANNGSKILLED